MRTVVGMSLFLTASAAFAQGTADCASLQAAHAQAAHAQAGAVTALAPELVAPTAQLGAPGGVLEQALDDALSADQVVLRMRVEGCMLAKAAPAPAPGMPSSTDAAAYQPKTEFDNTPWRFDMNQNGKRMTAEEFDAWLKAKGVRVAKGAAPAAEPAPAAGSTD